MPCQQSTQLPPTNEVRNSTTVEYNYTFLDSTGNVIPLTGYTAISMEIKVPGQAAVSTAATVLSPSAGTVRSIYQLVVTNMPVRGIIAQFQFFVTLPGPTIIPGTPIPVLVLPNVTDLVPNSDFVIEQ